MKLRFFITLLILGFATKSFGQFAPWGTGINMAYPQCPYELGGNELSELSADMKEAKKQLRLDKKDLERIKNKVGTGNRDDYFIDFNSEMAKNFFIDFIEGEKTCSDLATLCSINVEEQTQKKSGQGQSKICEMNTQLGQGETPYGCNGNGVDYDAICSMPELYKEKNQQGKNEVGRYIRECKTWVKDLKKGVQNVKESLKDFEDADKEYREAKQEIRDEERERRRAIRRGEEPPESAYCETCQYGRRRERKIDKTALGVGVLMDVLLMRENRKNVKTVTNAYKELGWGVDPSFTNPWYSFGYGFPFATMAALSGGGGGYYGAAYGGIGGGAWGCASFGAVGSPYGPAGYMTPYGPYMNPYGQVPSPWGMGVGAGLPGFNPMMNAGFMPGYPPWGMNGPWAGASAGVGFGIPGYPFLQAGAGIQIGAPFGGVFGGPGAFGGMPWPVAGAMGGAMGGMGGPFGGMMGGMPPYGGFGGIPGFGGPYGGMIGGPMGGMGGPFGGSIFGPGSGLGLQYQQQMYQMQMQMQYQAMEAYQRQMQTQMMQYQALQQVQMEMSMLTQRYYQIMYGGGLGITGVTSGGPFGNTPVNNGTGGPFNNQTQPVR